MDTTLPPSPNLKSLAITRHNRLELSRIPTEKPKAYNPSDGTNNQSQYND
jgi:hypothetical protein